MNYNKKPTPLIAAASNRICPVCGNVSYSRSGIHPQCAVLQADEPRKQRLQQERKEAGKNKPKAAEKEKPKSWTKRCPKCRAELHARRKDCDCGHQFGAS